MIEPHSSTLWERLNLIIVCEAFLIFSATLLRQVCKKMRRTLGL